MKKIMCLIISILITLTNILAVVPVSAASSTDMPVVVSLGDSFSSGEGIEPFYGQYDANSYYCEDWIAHRSALAWSGLIEYKGVTLYSVKATSSADLDSRLYRYEGVEDGTWYFAAASGAVTDNVLSEKNGGEKQPKTVTSDETTNKNVDDYTVDNYYLDYQIDTITSLPEDVTVDYVTMTIGGNDVGFTSVISKAVCSGLGLANPNAVKDMLYDTISQFWETDDPDEVPVAEKLEKVYKEILQEAPDATLVIAGYPRLIYMDSENQTTNCWWCKYYDAYIINRAVAIFDNYIEQIVDSLNTDQAIYVDVKDAFSGHEAGADDAYINGLEILSNTSENIDKSSLMGKYVSDSSVHPNVKGALAYASAVQEALNKIDSGFGNITYNTTSTLNVYDVNFNLYDNYTVDITGETLGYLFGIINLDMLNEEYSDTITVSSSETVSLELPEGNYTITVTDNNDASNYFTKEVEIRSSENTEINIYTDFETTYGNNILADAVEYNDHYYQYIEDSSITTWEEAKEYCESVGGYLVTITSQEEQDFVFDYIEPLVDDENVFIGIQNANNSTNWETWDNGEDVTYTSWGSGEPDNYNGSQDYGAMSTVDRSGDSYDIAAGQWDDVANNDDKVYGHFICEWDDDSINSSETIKTVSSEEKDIVLVLDTSGSMSGTSMDETKNASTEFIETILEEDASIGIVTYSEYASKESDFSMNETTLETIVDNMYATGGTNMEAGLSTAYTMLDESNAKKKIIVLMSDGLPNQGKVGSDLIEYADSIKDDDITIYTLGFFSDVGSDKASCQSLMESIASDGCHYEVASEADLTYFFEDIADQINGQKYIYARVACPVDVTIAYNGEVLSSNDSLLNTRTSFGTLTFEETEDDSEDQIKVIRLKEGVDYDITINGTGYGSMDYTIGFMDDDGNYSDFRTFENITITTTTSIDTVAKVSDSTVLNVDSDGDGSYDIRYRAKANSRAEEVPIIPWVRIIIIGVIAVIVVITTSILVIRKRRKARV